MTTTQPSTLTAEQLKVMAKLGSKITELGYTCTFVPPIKEGPIVSVYRFKPTGTTRVSNIEGMASDFAVVLGTEDVFVKRMPGDSAIGVYVPNETRANISYLSTVQNVWNAKDILKVPLNFGVDHMGTPEVEDLTTLPHLLIAGSTGSGKSTLLSAIISSIIYCKAPSDVRFILSDTKNVEFGHFIGAPHLVCDPLTSIYQTMEKMDWLIDEMNRRLKLLAAAGCRNVHELNTLFEKSPSNKKLGFLVLVIDELADLLSSREKNDEDKVSLGKLAEHKLATIVQKSRAAGVYVIAATQRPSVNIVSGSIKANFPARLTFRLPSEADSRTVLGFSGAEHLLSQGDMLYVSPNKPGLTRMHAPYARIEDIQAAVSMAMGRDK